jgi:hypothetical protein
MWPGETTVVYRGGIRHLLGNNPSSRGLVVRGTRFKCRGMQMVGENTTRIPAVLIVEDEPMVRLSAVKRIEEAESEAVH